VTDRLLTARGCSEVAELPRVAHVNEVCTLGEHAVVGGFPAWFLFRLLADLPGGLDAKLGRYGLPPERHAAVLRAVAALEHAATAWRLNRATSASGSDQTSDVEAAVRSQGVSGMSEQLLPARDAASVLGLTDRGVRLLASQGRLAGSRDSAGRWFFHRDVIAAERERRVRGAA
jgi:hypothetical protein